MGVEKFRWKKWMWEVLLLNVLMLVFIISLFLFSTGKKGLAWALWGVIASNGVYYFYYKIMMKILKGKEEAQIKKKQEQKEKVLDNKIKVCKKFQEQIIELNKYIERKKQEENGNLEIIELEKRKDEILKLLVQFPEINDYERMRNRTEIKRRKVSEIVDLIYYNVLECNDKTKSLEYCYCIMRNCYSDIILAAGTCQLIWEKEKAEIEG